jgi:hypothetical protein
MMSSGGVKAQLRAFSTSALDRSRSVLHEPPSLPVGKEMAAHCVGGSVGPRAGLRAESNR